MTQPENIKEKYNAKVLYGCSRTMRPYFKIDRKATQMSPPSDKWGEALLITAALYLLITMALTYIIFYL